LHVYEDQLASENSRSNRVNIEALNGVDNADSLYQSGLSVGSGPQVGNHVLFCGRVMADGTCSWDITVGAAGADLTSRIYEFSGVNTGPSIDKIGENLGGSGGGRYRQVAGTNTTPGDAAVVTSGGRELALAFVLLQGQQSIGNFTGETGGDWAEVAEYSHTTGTGCTMQLQTAEMLAPGTIDGGTMTITSAPWGVLGLALFPANPSDTPSVAWLTA
jgi:hypothetical protein